MTAPRPLYVDSAAAGIRLEGPALVVARPARADTRVPLRRLARVVVRGGVPFDTDALLGCLGAGVPVTFVALNGQVLGYCIGPERRAWSIGPLLERLVADPDWPEFIGRWTRHAESEVIQRTCRRMRLQPDLDTRPATVRTKLAQALPGGATPGAEAVLRRLDGLLRAHLAELLQRAGIPPRYRGQEASPLDLRPCFAAALCWHLWPTAARVLDHRRRHPDKAARRGRGVDVTGERADPPDEPRRRLVVAYEATAPMIEAEFRRGLACLDLLLREHLS
jgi:hypothetical protein